MALANANHEMEKALGPILKQVMADHHANIVVDKQAVILATDNSFDVIAGSGAEAGCVLPSVKVELPPARCGGRWRAERRYAVDGEG